ncbi:oxygen-dependent protoporphyrinogen oxidase [Mycoemilia scoparia]|uniref:Protoporphyrinogen oxidase n=1 Tax=Mycoemilia scoparia TaxID=417184 RepID=A0A9W8DPJ6_9FUNG|nr:oxygen-dependent protoporphyrinogen oxidase [Mycoemilia scoparia]
MSSPKYTITILGGGISGLSSAWHFSKQLAKATSKELKDASIVLIEASDSFGGWMDTSRKTLSDGTRVVYEKGPRTLRAGPGRDCKAVIEMIDDLGIQDKVVFASKTSPAALNKFIYYDGQLHLMPTKPQDIVKRFPAPMRCAPLGLLQDLLWPRNTPKDKSDESVHSLVSRRFGAAVDDNLVSAGMVGIHAADSKLLSSRGVMNILWQSDRMTGSAVLGMGKVNQKREQRLTERARKAYQVDEEDWKKRVAEATSESSEDLNRKAFFEKFQNSSVYSFKGGMKTLVDSLVSNLEKDPRITLLKAKRCQNLNYNDGGVFDIALDDGQVLKSDYIVSAIPTYQLNSILENSSSNLVLPEFITELPYTDVAVVGMTFKNKDIIENPGFGFLVPRSAWGELKALGVVFDSCSLPEIDDGQNICRISVMLGGTNFESRLGSDVDTVSESTLAAAAIETIRTALGINEEPLDIKININKKCIPTYKVGYIDMLEDLDKWLASNFDGKLSVVGSAYGGPAVPMCILHSKDLAAEWIQALQGTAAVSEETSGNANHESSQTAPAGARIVTGLKDILTQY